jgi:glycosyltransferase involved in cell wall biosynthesis
VAAGFPRTGVLPVVPSFDHLETAAAGTIAESFDDGWTNILFVGRMVPNKKIEDLIRFFHAYHTGFNPRSRLIIVGMYNLFERYLAGLAHMAAELGLSHVHFAGHVSNEELVAYYEIADLFLCASEHEGFCVPLVEAFYKQVPVVAYAATAVPGTMDGAGVLFDDKDPKHVAALIDAVVSNAQLQDEICEGQLAAVRRLQAKDFAGRLLGFVDRILRSPRAPLPRVAPDFWRQFDQAEFIDEIRKYRPAAFKALPEAR